MPLNVSSSAREAFSRGLDPRVAAGMPQVNIPQAVQGGGMGGMGGKIGAFMKGPWGPFIGLLLAQLGGSMALGKYDELAGMGVQQEGMEKRGEAMDPQAMYYQAMMPQYEQQEEQSRAMLMQTIMGGGGQLAEGQEMFGGV